MPAGILSTCVSCGSPSGKGADTTVADAAPACAWAVERCWLRLRRQTRILNVPVMSSPRASLLPLFLGFCPLLVFHLTHYLSARQGYVPWCNPYLDGCTSISATGRDGIAFFVFKLAMLPTAWLLYLYWQLAWQRVRLLMRPGQFQPWTRHLGSLAAFFLVLYTLALGLEGDGFQLTRRIGVIFFFTFTYLCQLLFTYQQGHLGLNTRTHPWQVALCALVLALGLLTLVLDLRLANYDDYEDSFEWGITALLQAYFVLSFWSWRELDARLALRYTPAVSPQPECDDQASRNSRN